MSSAASPPELGMKRMRHRVERPVDDSTDARLSALERQQVYDHEAFEEIKHVMEDLAKMMQHQGNDVKHIFQDNQAQAAKDLQLRRDMNLFKDHMKRDAKFHQEEVNGSVAVQVLNLVNLQMGPAVDAKVQIIAD